MEFSPLVDGRWDYGEWGNDLACSPVLALTIQKISINYCSFHLFEGTLIGPGDWLRSQVVTKRGGKPRAGNIEHCSDYTREYQKREKNAGFQDDLEREEVRMGLLTCVSGYASPLSSSTNCTLTRPPKRYVHPTSVGCHNPCAYRVRVELVSFLVASGRPACLQPSLSATIYLRLGQEVMIDLHKYVSCTGIMASPYVIVRFRVTLKRLVLSFPV